MQIVRQNPTLFTKHLLQLERMGRYEEAIADLNEIWEDTTKQPDISDFNKRDGAEILLRCGSLIGFLGHNKQIQNSQESSKNLLTEARNKYLDLYDLEKIAECETYLAMAYSRTGEMVEAQTWIEEALNHKIPTNSITNLHSHLIKTLIFIFQSKYEETVTDLKNLQPLFEKYGDDFLNGSLYTNLGIALRNIGEPSEAVKAYKLARIYHQKSGHQIYLGTIENNLAYLYKSENDYANAHRSVDNAIKIYKGIKDRTRKGSSLDTKANIYFDEGNFTKALATIDESIRVLRRSENAAYKVESYLTKSKILVFLDDIASASLTLSEGIELARKQISEDAAKKLAREFEIAIRKKALFADSEKVSERNVENTELEIVLPTSLAEYEDFQVIRIKNDHLNSVGLQIGFLGIVVEDEINGGDLVAINEIETDSVVCGFYDSYFGMVSITVNDTEPILYKQEEIKVLGKIVGYGNTNQSSNGKILIEPILQ